MTELIKLTDIRTDAGTQSRANMDWPKVNEYTEQMREQGGYIDFPPITAFYDGEKYILVDGFHRRQAAENIHLEYIPAEIKQGDRRAAVLYSVGVNARHGLPRTNEDKRRAVQTLLSDPEWAAWSNVQIAKQCGVVPSFVLKVRREIETAYHGDRVTERKGADGKIYSVPNIGKSAPKPDPVIIDYVPPEDDRDESEDESIDAFGKIAATQLPGWTDDIDPLMFYPVSITEPDDPDDPVEMTVIGCAFQSPADAEAFMEENSFLTELILGSRLLYKASQGHIEYVSSFSFAEMTASADEQDAISGDYLPQPEEIADVAIPAPTPATTEDRKAFGVAIGNRTPDGSLVPLSAQPDYDGDEWYTPPEVIEAVRAVLGEINLDPASCGVAQETVKASVFFNKWENGLKFTWRGNVFLNPPYSQPLVTQFTSKLMEEFFADNVKQAILLVNNCTDASWFQDLLGQGYPVCFPSGRIKFSNPHYGTQATRQGQAIFYFGDQRREFTRVFSKFGIVLQWVASMGSVEDEASEDEE